MISIGDHMIHRLLGMPILTLATVSFVGSSVARADLLEYVHRPDPSYTWKSLGSETTPAGVVTSFEFTSQTWQGIVWKHDLTVYEPKDVRFPDALLLLIGGGKNGSSRSDDHRTGFLLAKLCGARVAVLPQVPNQPLLGDKAEDTLIAETFVRFLETGDETWPLLLPMAKSAVRAMDAVQEWAKTQGKPATKFVVTGASKRGWTTWLTGAVDDRVVAIAPIVIPTLNFKAQLPHQFETWGKYSEQIADYTNRHLVEDFESPPKVRLWKTVDPYTYLDRLSKKPTLQINGTNDRYWTLDSVNLYWDDIRGPKSVVYLPNSGHGLNQNTDYATHGVGALFRQAVSGRSMPELEWKHSDLPDGRLRLELTKADPLPDDGRVMIARSETKDFRDAHWEPAPADAIAGLTFTTDRPKSGYLAYFGDLTYRLDDLDYHLSTQIRIVGPQAEPSK